MDMGPLSWSTFFDPTQPKSTEKRKVEQTRPTQPVGAPNPTHGHMCAIQQKVFKKNNRKNKFPIPVMSENELL